jgi:multidrug efflux pump subunit AcrA (membrane-fusion protein)
LVAGGAPSKIIAFLPERDRAFVTSGAEIRVEVEQLPYAEFGTLKGRVDRVATDLASRYEVTEALGEEAQYPGPSYRVELSLLEDDRAKQLSSKLRAGMLVNARFTLRRRRLISLVLDPLRRWLR